MGNCASQHPGDVPPQPSSSSHPSAPRASQRDASVGCDIGGAPQGQDVVAVQGLDAEEGLSSNSSSSSSSRSSSTSVVTRASSGVTRAWSAKSSSSGSTAAHSSQDTLRSSLSRALSSSLLRSISLGSIPHGAAPGAWTGAGAVGEGAGSSLGQVCHFEQLPQEVLINVLARTPARMHSALKAVCREWRVAISSPEFIEFRAAGKLREQWVVIAASEGDHEPFSFRVRVFDCHTRCWLTLAIPKELQHLGPGFGAAVLGRTLYVCGGEYGRRLRSSTATWGFDFGTKKWARLGNMITARNFHALGAVSGHLVAAGGEIPSLDDFCLSETYDPRSDTWQEIPNSALPARRQTGWVVRSALYVRHLPDRVYKIILEPGKGVEFKIIPNRRELDPILGGMDYVTSMDGRVYGCMVSGHISSVGVFNDKSRVWHLLIGNGVDFHRIFERFDGMVCGGGCLYIITIENALLQVVMEERGSHAQGPEWSLLSKGYPNPKRVRWRQFGCVEL